MEMFFTKTHGILHQEERNVRNMTEFLVNRPVVVLVENHKLPWARSFGQRNC